MKSIENFQITGPLSNRFHLDSLEIVQSSHHLFSYEIVLPNKTLDSFSLY